MSDYNQGRRVEYAVIHDLQQAGYETIRAASSKGLADVVAIKEGQVLLVNCKRTTMPGPGERADLLRIAAMLPFIAVPIVALHPFRLPLVYRQLTGPGPKDWAPWPLDFAEAVR
jgi:hypothetical protein